MIRLTCDNCEQLLEVPDDAAGQKVKCPACGDVRVIPGAAVPTAAPTVDRAAQAGLPSSTAPEQRVLRVHQAMFRARPFLFVVLLLFTLAGLAGSVYYGLVDYRASFLIGSVCGAVIGMGAFGFWKLKTLDTSLDITNKRTIARKGIFSRFTSEVLHHDVKNIQVTQSFFDRIMGVGRIGISSAGQDEIEIVADDIPGPDRVRRTIDLYRTL